MYIHEQTNSQCNALQLKLKKRQKEAERCTEIVLSNLILLRHLAEISLSKRVDDGMNPKGGAAADWNYDHYGTIAALRNMVARWL